MKWKKLREYDALCLKTDVLLLADVYENFIVISIKNYGLNPLNYVPAPGLSWDSFFEKIKSKARIDNCFFYVNFFRRAICGGVSMITTKFSKSNNKYQKSHAPNKESKFMITCM